MFHAWKFDIHCKEWIYKVKQPINVFEHICHEQLYHSTAINQTFSIHDMHSSQRHLTMKQYFQHKMTLKKHWFLPLSHFVNVKRLRGWFSHCVRVIQGTLGGFQLLGVSGVVQRFVPPMTINILQVGIN